MREYNSSQIFGENQGFGRFCENDRFETVGGQGVVNEGDEDEEEDEIDVDDWFSYIFWIFLLLFYFLIFKY